ncbi:hypothetical protein TNCV_2648841, partial [Trichonephila clavipes]
SVYLKTVRNKNAIFIIGAFLIPPLLAFTGLDPFFRCGESPIFSSQVGHLIACFEIKEANGVLA